MKNVLSKKQFEYLIDATRDELDTIYELFDYGMSKYGWKSKENLPNINKNRYKDLIYTDILDLCNLYYWILELEHDQDKKIILKIKNAYEIDSVVLETIPSKLLGVIAKLYENS